MSSNTLNFEYNNGWGRRGCVATQPLTEKSESDPTGKRRERNPFGKEILHRNKRRSKCIFSM